MKSFLTFAAMVLIAAVFEESGLKAMASAINGLACFFLLLLFLGWEPFRRSLLKKEKS